MYVHLILLHPFALLYSQFVPHSFVAFLQIVMNDPSADTRPERCIALSVTVTTHLLFMPTSALRMLAGGCCDLKN